MAPSATAEALQPRGTVTYDGRTIVDAGALASSGKVRETLARISKAVKSKSIQRGRGLIVLKKRPE